MYSYEYINIGHSLEKWGELDESGAHAKPGPLSVGHSQFDMGTSHVGLQLVTPGFLFQPLK